MRIASWPGSPTHHIILDLRDGTVPGTGWASGARPLCGRSFEVQQVYVFEVVTFPPGICFECDEALKRAPTAVEEPGAARCRSLIARREGEGGVALFVELPDGRLLGMGLIPDLEWEAFVQKVSGR